MSLKAYYRTRRGGSAQRLFTDHERAIEFLKRPPSHVTTARLVDEEGHAVGWRIPEAESTKGRKNWLWMLDPEVQS